MLPTLKYTVALHGHIRGMRDGAAFVLDNVGWGSTTDTVFAAWNTLAMATTDLWAVAS